MKRKTHRKTHQAKNTTHENLHLTGPTALQFIMTVSWSACYVIYLCRPETHSSIGCNFATVVELGCVAAAVRVYLKMTIRNPLFFNGSGLNFFGQQPMKRPVYQQMSEEPLVPHGQEVFTIGQQSVSTTSSWKICISFAFLLASTVHASGR